MLLTVRVQEKGQVTIPTDIRRRLRVKKGDLVTFVVKDDDVVLQSLDDAVIEAFLKLERMMDAKGISLSINEFLDTVQKRGGEAAASEFDLSQAEQAALYTALQLQAQKALETIRQQAEKTGLNQLSEEEIEAEIQAARNEVSRSNRT